MTEVQNKSDFFADLGRDKASEGDGLVKFRHEQTRGNVLWGFLEHLRYMCQRILGCWHRQMSFPVTRGGETYRVCVHCGMRRHFHLVEWKMTGRYYNDASETHARVETNRMELTPQQTQPFKLQTPIV